MTVRRPITGSIAVSTMKIECQRRLAELAECRQKLSGRGNGWLLLRQG
jgi:hypothetical protein